MLSRLLFVLCTLVAGLLAAAVLLAPWLPVQSPVVLLFAGDAVVRRTALAGACGLVVTACFFFRSSGLGRARKPRRPPPQNIAGA